MAVGESWGRYPQVESAVEELWWPREAGAREGCFLPVGLGRSYGDSGLLGRERGTMLSVVKSGRFLGFDEQSGVLEVEAGCSLDEILRWSVPRGLFLAVVPGTCQVTVGGAIANDIHGKNHHRKGTFGRAVEGFELWRGGESPLWCDREQHGELFEATIGGLGLTGVIGRVRLKLVPILGNGLVAQNSVRFGTLAEGAQALQALDGDYPYTVAWIDMASARMGQGVAMGGDFVEGEVKEVSPRGLNVPFCAPNCLLNRFAIRGFNAFYSATRREGLVKLGFREFFFPLDGIQNWGRLYGKRGFLQYQCVVPESELAALEELQRRIAQSGQGAFLSVLKKFGAKESPGWLSFPFAGWTLAMDFPNQGEVTLSMMKGLDEVVRAAGGRLYPAKDARMAGDFFRESYPRWEELEGLRDSRITSEFWERVRI